MRWVVWRCKSRSKRKMGSVLKARVSIAGLLRLRYVSE